MTTTSTEPEDLGDGLMPGDRHYRAYIGVPENYDIMSAMIFNLLTALGLRGRHRLLDIGCGSLRVGRLLIPYLNQGNYVGIDPVGWLIKRGLQQETGEEIVKVKSPKLLVGDSPSVIEEDEQFDFALAHSIFSHCSLDVIRIWLAGVSYHLKPDGIFIATFYEGEKNYLGSDWVYPEFVTYTREKMSSLAEEADLQFTILDWEHPKQPWALFTPAGYDLSWITNNELSWNSTFRRQFSL